MVPGNLAMPSSATPAPVTSSSTSTPTPSATESTGFCLEVVTPGLSITEYRVASYGEDLNMIYQAPGSTSVPIAFFKIQPSGALTTLDGLLVTLTASASPYSN